MTELMSDAPEKLQQLYEVLQASKAAKYFVKVYWPEYPNRLSIRNAWGNEYDDILVHITIDGSNPEKFKYQVLSNNGLRSTEKYLTIEEKESVSSRTILEAVYRLLTP